MVACKKPQKGRKKGERLRRDRDQIKFILDLRDGKFEDSGNEEGKTCHKLHVIGDE